MLIDCHAHLCDESFDEDRAEIIEKLRAAGIVRVMETGADLEGSEKAVRLASENELFRAVVGSYPHSVAEMDEDNFARLAKLAESPVVVGIGEIGLDYHHKYVDKETQMVWFRRQIDLALDMRLPIVIHCREADEDVFMTLRERGAFSKERTSVFPVHPDGGPDARVMIHCYSGSAEMARQYAKLGATLSFGGTLTYRNARKAVESALAVDITRIVLETDSPYLMPLTRVGRNDPSNVAYPARTLAELKKMSYDDVCRITTENAIRLFDL